MTIVRQPCGKGRAVVEGVKGLALCEFQLLLERIYLLPILQHFLFLIGEVGSLRD